MLTPEYLEGLPEPILALYAQVEEDILRDMARRIAAYDYWIPAADWQNRKLKEAGRLQEDILQIMADYSGKTEAELRDLMQQATADGLRSDISVYEGHGETVPPISESQALVDTLNAGYRATRQTMRNLTRTTARTATQQFERSLDRAWLQVRSGAFSSDQAVASAVKELARRGVECIRYPSGHTDTIEVAVRRAVVTGVNKTTCELQDKLAEELECDLVEVTAHAGARPSHTEWQGKVYSRSGKSSKYPDFVKSTGYGTGAGLGGWNCRHSFHPYYEGSSRTWTDEQLEKLKDKTVTYNGEKLTEYEASQKQRYIEQQIRKWKREAAAMEAAGLDPSEANAKVRHWQATMRDFTQQTGLKRQSEREQVATVSANNVPEPLASSVKSGIIKSDALEASAESRKGWTEPDPAAKRSIQQGFEAFPEGDVLKTRAQRIEPDGASFDVAMHGASDGVGFGTDQLSMTARELAKVIKNDPGYHGQSVRLLSCDTGKTTPDGEYCVAEELANALGVTVKAPNDTIFIRGNGSWYIGEYGEGAMITFEPNQRRRLK